MGTMTLTMAPTAILNLLQIKMNIFGPSSSSSSSSAAAAAAAAAAKGRSLQSVQCTPVQQIEHQVEARIMCEPCDGTGWLLCDFCKGQKTNVKAANNRIYRRCPSCKAIGCILCPKCKVFKCVTLPNCSDSEDVTV